MKILLICNEYPPSKHGGIGTVTRELAEGLVNNGIKVIVVGVYNKFVLPIKNPIVEILNDVEVVRLPECTLPLPTLVLYLLNRIKLFFWLFNQIRNNFIDLVEVPDYEGMLPWGTPGRIPVICRGHGSAFYFDAELNRRRASRLTYFFEKRTLRKANHLVFVSKYTAKKELELSRQSRDYAVIYNCVDTSVFSPDRSSKRIKGLILFVNTIVPKKGVEQLMEAMNLVFEARPDAKLVLLGKCSNPQYLDFLISKLHSNFQEQVQFLGHVDRTEVVSYMQKANVCVFPSYSEAFAMGPLEAMATGSPVVFTQRASGAETLDDGISGLLCNPYDPLDISRKILRILENDEFAAEIGDNARKRVLENFDKKDWIMDNIVFYRSVSKSLNG